MIEAIDLVIEPGNTVIAQGERVRLYESMGYYRYQGGCGTYRMVKPSNILLIFKDEEGKIMRESVKQFIRDYYGYKRVTEKLAIRFLKDLKSQRIKLNYTNTFGFTAI